MLPVAHRLTDPAAFAETVRSGRRAGSRTLVVHLLAERSRSDLAGGPWVGLVVNKAVGNAVARNRVKRRLRHLMAVEVDKLPAGSIVVVRALPAAAASSYAALGEELRRGLARCQERTPEMSP